MKLIADSGSTKTDWCVKDGSSTIAKVKTQGINPFHMEEEMIASVLHEQLIPALKEELSALDKNAFMNIECGDNFSSGRCGKIQCDYDFCRDRNDKLDKHCKGCADRSTADPEQ